MEGGEGDGGPPVARRGYGASIYDVRTRGGAGKSRQMRTRGRGVEPIQTSILPTF